METTSWAREHERTITQWPQIVHFGIWKEVPLVVFLGIEKSVPEPSVTSTIYQGLWISANCTQSASKRSKCFSSPSHPKTVSWFRTGTPEFSVAAENHPTMFCLLVLLLLFALPCSLRGELEAQNIKFKGWDKNN